MTNPKDKGDPLERLRPTMPPAVIAAWAADAQAAIERLTAELAEWHKLRDPESLHVNLLRGIPAQLSEAQRLHLAGVTDADALRKDAERYRWLRSTTNWASSNGERIDVRSNPALWDSAIDAAMQASVAKA